MQDVPLVKRIIGNLIPEAFVKRAISIVWQYPETGREVCESLKGVLVSEPNSPRSAAKSRHLRPAVLAVHFEIPSLPVLRKASDSAVRQGRMQ